MSWLGVNLNESLSNIKGQISSFTRDVLAEEDEARDEDIEIRVPKKRIKEYETSVYLCQQEIKELKESRAEVEERFRTTDYQRSQKITSLLKQLSESQEQLHQSKEKSSEWGWEAGDGKGSSKQTYQVPESVHVEKVSFLKKQLDEERRRHEEEVLAIQDAHLGDIRRLKAKEENGSISSSKDVANVSKNDEFSERKKDDGRIKEFEEEVNALKSELEAVYNDKKQLDTSLVDLDCQHQFIIDELLKSKKELVKELENSKDEIQKLRESNSDRRKEEQEERSQLISFSEKIEGLSRENSRLQRLLEESKIKERREKESSLEELESLRGNVDEQADRIKKLNSELEEETRKEVASGSEIQRLSNLVRELEENCKSISRLQDEVTQTKERDEWVRGENETLKRKLSSTEREYDQRCKTIAELNDKIVSQEEEILKFEAVLEEKNVEHTNTYRKLKQHEEMTRLTIREFQEEGRELKNRIQELEIRNKKDEKSGEKVSDSSQNGPQCDAIIKELVNKCSVQNFEDLPSVVSELNSEIALLRCERDRLSEDLNSTVQDLRESQELIENLETEKADLERETEDLRDQLEELQCGERAPPEGSLTPRSLPTIEEEEMDGNLMQAEEAETEKNCANEESKKDNAEANSELLEKINHLTSRVTALSEVRQNLEIELSRMKREKGELEQRLSEVDLQLVNISSSEVEALTTTLRNENECSSQVQSNDHSKNCSLAEEEKNKLERQIEQMTNAMDKMNFDSAHLLSREEEYKRDREALQEQISAQNKTIHEYFHEIARLKTLLNENNNASLLVAEYQGKLSTMQAELDKAKGLVIYKDDQIDQLRQEVEQIGEIFNLRDLDVHRLHIRIKQERFTLISKLNETKEELETLREENENLKVETEESDTEGQEDSLQKLKTDLEAANVQLSDKQNELERLKESKDILFKDSERELKNVKSQNEMLLTEKGELLNHSTTLNEENDRLRREIRVFDEKSSNADNVLKEKEAIIAKLEKEIIDKEEYLRGKITSLEEQLSLKLNEIESLNQLMTKNTSEVQSWTREKLENLEKELDQTMLNASKLSEENATLKHQVSELQSERQQMVITSTQKHQESLAYYNEIQKLSDVLQKEKQCSTAELEALNERLRLAAEKQRKVTEEANSLRQNLVETQNNFIPKTEAMKLQEECKTKNCRLNEELGKQQEMYKVILKERDHLRLANSSFNLQYEEKSKEVVALQEKEKYLSQEIQRLKQHLVEVEETYTNEAVKSEERETALRQSLARMHDKMASHSTHYSNANQKTAAQLESMQEQLHEAIHQRDEVRMQLQASEEASSQHQEALVRLQQVLQDFQKTQLRDIAMATEREKRKFEGEREKNVELEIQFKEMKGKLAEVEESLASTLSVRKDLQAKEDTVIALKSQVHAIQLAAKKNQEQVALLQSSADVKVDKHLLRNLIVGYFATPSDKQREVLRVVAQVLDFSPEERSRTGIDYQPGSWLNSIANFLAPPPSNIRIASKVDVLDHSSLSQAFIRFLEEESSPRTQPRLPAVQMAEEANQKAQKKAQSKANSAGGTSGSNSSDNLSAALSPVPVQTVISSSSSVGEITNSLLFTSSPTLPGTFPVISAPAVSTGPALSSQEVSTPKFLNNLLNSKETKAENDSSS